MKIPIFASVIAIVFALLERLNGEKRHPSAYFVLFLLILGSMYAAVAYCDEPEREEQFVFGDYYDEKEVHYEPREFKFVPDGTPPSYINEDGTPSNVLLKIVRSTDMKTAKMSKSLHKQKGEQNLKEAEELCWYLPDISKREKCKMIFVSCMSTIPAPPPIKLVTAIITALTQYGLCCIDEFHDIDYKINMSKYHFMLEEAFAKHIAEKGW